MGLLNSYIMTHLARAIGPAMDIAGYRNIIRYQDIGISDIRWISLNIAGYRWLPG